MNFYVRHSENNNFPGKTYFLSKSRPKICINKQKDVRKNDV